ncbi:hypothetical protein [Hymenobacter psychrophilus]|uniref:Uncharacterized protein n=1 Tax=Hymenobacter psychrophilus TaxID=651662 RepID=A0A1H3EUK8_9BACT|nr:hypothetical protein [Hymenobacter psychrophilus]SDX82295.1 hypothetical protein SAMN04488069_103309 [Hymenobacter psychrophilus]
MLTASLLGTACTKDCDPIPESVATTPAQAATLNVNFAYAGSTEERSVSYVADKPNAELLSDRLLHTISSEATTTGPADRVTFALAKSRQKPELVGTYSLSSQPDASQGDVQVSFIRFTPSTNTSNNTISGNQNQLNGSLIITTYDEARKLISGTYEVKATGIRDVFAFRNYADLNPDAQREGNLRVHGSFTEIRLLP